LLHIEVWCAADDSLHGQALIKFEGLHKWN